MPKGVKNVVKNPFCLKPARLYRYRLVVYRYRLASAPFCITCTGTGLPVQVRPVSVHLFQFFIFLILFIYFLCGSIFIFLQIGNSSADVKSILVKCLPPRVSLHALLSFCSYSAQTDCVHEGDNCTSFFSHFQTFHGAHCFYGDQNS